MYIPTYVIWFYFILGAIITTAFLAYDMTKLGGYKAELYKWHPKRYPHIYVWIYYFFEWILGILGWPVFFLQVLLQWVIYILQKKGPTRKSPKSF